MTGTTNEDQFKGIKESKNELIGMWANGQTVFTKKDFFGKAKTVGAQQLLDNMIKRGFLVKVSEHDAKLAHIPNETYRQVKLCKPFLRSVKC